MTQAPAAIELPRPVNSVAFTCDFLRFAITDQGYSSFQPRNLAWLVEVLAGAGAWQSFGVETSVVMPPRDCAALESAIGSSAALTDYRDSADYAWALRYDRAEPDVFDSVFERLCQHDLVVGFEMAPTIRRLLHTRRKPYLNFYIHPLRFLRDLCLGATTNCPTIADSLRATAVGQHEIDSQVRRYRALFLRRQLALCTVPPGLPVLVGQTERDSVLIKEGRFAGWEDFADDIDRLLADFDEVVFLEHPYRPSSGPVLEYLRSVHGKTVIATNANSYGVLLSNGVIPMVLTLASSLGVEASAMGLQTRFLLADPRRKLELPEFELPIESAFGHGVLGAPFWSSTFGQGPTRRMLGRSGQDNSFALGDHYLRNSLDAWSFRALQSGLTGMTGRKTMLPASTLTPQRNEELLGHLTGSELPVSMPRAIEEARAHDIQLTLLDPPLRVGERREIPVSGPQANHYLATGFHPPEAWGGWSSEPMSQLVFAVGADTVAQGGQLDVSMSVRVFEGLLVCAPVMRIRCDGHLVGYVFFRSSGLNAQTVEFSLRPRTPICRVDLEMTDLGTPSAEGASADRRWLGFALSQLTVACSKLIDAPSSARHTLLWGVGTDPVTLGGNGVGV
jgi:hypothetical protein